MPFKVRRLLLPLALLCVSALLCACGPSNYVRLMYTPNAESVLPKADAPRVTVVAFSDERSTQGIGERRDGTAFMPSSLVTDWVSRSLGEELARLGLQVSYAPTTNTAAGANAPYVATGVIREIWIKETSATSVTATIRLTVTLANQKGIIYSENLSATQERKALPSSSMVEGLVADTLRDVLVPAAKKLYERIQ